MGSRKHVKEPIPSAPGEELTHKGSAVTRAGWRQAALSTFGNQMLTLLGKPEGQEAQRGGASLEREQVMAKQGQHKRDINDPRISKGPNNPSKSQPMTTGPYKKPETYRKQALEHEDPGRKHPAKKLEWHDDTRVPASLAGKGRIRRLRPRWGASGKSSATRRP